MSGIQQGLIATVKTPASRTYATRNPSDKSTALTLSNGDLTMTSTNANWLGARSTISKTSGKWYWEVTVNSSLGGLIGVANASYTLNTNTYLGQDANGWGWFEQGFKSHNGLSAYTSFTSGTIVGVALDMDNGTITFYKNGVSQGLAFTGITGTIYACSTIGINGDNCVTNFGATTMAYTAPAGYNQGLYN